MKKISTFFLCLLLALTMLGCATQTATKNEPVPAPAAEEPKEEPVPAPAEDASTEDASTEDASATDASADPVVTLRFACDDATTSTFFLGMEKFKEVAEAESGGSIKVELYGNAQLGSAKDTLEALQYGTLECAYTAISQYVPYVPEYNVIDAPFMIRDAAHATAVLDGEIGQWLDGLILERTGIRVMGHTFAELRHVFSTKPVRTLEDFKGLKIRLMTSDIHIATFEALGAIPVTMASPEVFTALQTGTIDAGENCYSYIVDQKFQEVVDYIASTGHFFVTGAYSISDKVYQEMTPAQRAAVDKAAQAGTDYQRSIIGEANAAGLETLREAGLEITEWDRSVLEEAVASVYEDYQDLLPPETIEKIKNM